MQIDMIPDHLKKHVLGVVDGNVLWYCALLIKDFRHVLFAIRCNIYSFVNRLAIGMITF